MRRTLERAIVLTVVESATYDQRNSFQICSSKQNFVGTSTWEQIIRILEESEEGETGNLVLGGNCEPPF